MVRDGAMKSTSGTALYYPFIHPRDPNYLKQSLLYWDRVRRITPERVIIAGDEIVEGDNDPDVIAAARAGLLLNTSPTQYEEAAEQYFIRKVDELIADEEKYAAWRVDNTPLPSVRGEDSGVDYLHV